MFRIIPRQIFEDQLKVTMSTNKYSISRCSRRCHFGCDPQMADIGGDRLHKHTKWLLKPQQFFFFFFSGSSPPLKCQIVETEQL